MGTQTSSATSNRSRIWRVACCVAAVVAALVSATPALASLPASEPVGECAAPDAQGIVECHTGLDAGTIARIEVSQARSQWCWAASVAMILEFHGQTVPQDQIVTERYGQLVDLPATSMEDMTQALTRLPADAQAQPVRVTTRTAAPSARLHLNNNLVLSEMQAHRPVLVVRASHAMVLVHVRYERFPNGAVRVVAGTVIDPAQGAGVRNLARDELSLAWLAAVQPGSPDEAPVAPGRDDSLRAGLPTVVAGVQPR